MVKTLVKSKRDTPEAKRWLIVGAYKAGATEKHIARISGLSKTAVRHIILNYQKTGTPSIPKRIPNKIKQKLIVEYDEKGEIINTTDEEEEVIEEEKRKKKEKNQLKGNMTTKDIINYAINELRIPNEPKTTKNKFKIKLPPPSKYDQEIRGYEIWTHEDDMVLLNHVLEHLHGGGWNELELRFNGRHSARLCYDRWKHLKSLLLKGITDKPNTPW